MNRRGAVLIEVLAAVAILAVAGLGTVRYLAAVLDAEARQHDREAEIGRAERLLVATGLLRQDELEQRLGARHSGGFLVWVDRPEPFLFRIGVSSVAEPERELLATLVYRRDDELDER